MYTLYKKPTPPISGEIGGRLNDSTADNADDNQSQAASDERLLSHVTLGRVECRKYS